MIQIPSISVADQIEYLVNRKFPELHGSASRPVKPLGQHSVRFEYEDDYKPSQTTLNEAEKYHDSLKILSVQKIDSLYREEREKQLEEDDQQRFFNQPDAIADFDYWSRMARWTLDESVALMFSKDPKVVFSKRLGKAASHTSPFIKEYIKISELVLRAKSAKMLTDPIEPQRFINWAITNQLFVPKGLVEKVAAKWPNFVNWEKMYKDLLEENKRLESVAEKATEALVNKIGEVTSYKNDDQPLQIREKTSYLNIIGALLGVLLGKSSNGIAYSKFESQQSIIDAIHANYSSKSGLSKRNLEAKFAEAQKSLKNCLTDG